MVSFAVAARYIRSVIAWDTQRPYPGSMSQPPRTSDRIAHAALLAACLTPLIGLIAGACTRSLGADPVADIQHSTGIWSLRLLLFTLALTPLAHYCGWHELGRYRRSLGLCAFLYGCLHGLAYLVFDQFFAWGAVTEDLLRRPALTAGLGTLLVLTPLAATSFRGTVRLLGLQRWRKLHRLAYLAAGLAVFHYLWLVKQDIRDPALYALLLALLIILRLQPRASQRKSLTAARGETVR